MQELRKKVISVEPKIKHEILPIGYKIKDALANKNMPFNHQMN